MALESQSLPPEKIRTQIAGLRDDFIHDMPSDFWEGKSEFDKQMELAEAIMFKNRDVLKKLSES
jgi:hypothetical protein